MAISKLQKAAAAKKKPVVSSNTQSVTQSQKRQELWATASTTSSKRATVEDSDEDEEPGHVGRTLSPDDDTIMEEVDSASEKAGTGITGDPIELTDAEDSEEEEDSEISEPAEYCFSHWSEHIIRMTNQRLDCSCLCILQADSNCWICSWISLP